MRAADRDVRCLQTDYLTKKQTENRNGERSGGWTMVRLRSVPRWQQVIKHICHAAELLAAVDKHTESSASAGGDLAEHRAVAFPEANHATGEN